MGLLVAYTLTSVMAAWVIYGLRLSFEEFRLYLAHHRRCERAKRRPRVRLVTRERKRWNGKGVAVGSVVE